MGKARAARATRSTAPAGAAWARATTYAALSVTALALLLAGTGHLGTQALVAVCGVCTAALTLAQVHSTR